MFRLGWFLGNGFGMQPWYGNWAGRAMTDWTQPGLYVDLTTSLERAGFDLLFIEDTSMVEDTFGESMETTLKYGLMAPKNDPIPLVPLLTAATEHIGVVATMSTIQYPPFLAARSMVTLDHLTQGRVGINVVTSVTHRVAQNFGYDKHFAHAERYAMAEEWMEVVSLLWDSWEPGALVHDQETPKYADHTKVHTIDFEGKYFSCRGPLNTIPGPQRRPVVAQAGNSTPGRELAAKQADTMLALAKSPAEMKALRQDMDTRLIKHGRKPQDLKILFMATPYLGDTDSEAQERFNRFNAAKKDPDNIEKRLWYLSYVSGGVVDYAKYDLDSPVPQEVGNGETTTAKAWLEGSKELTLRDLAEGPSNYGMEFIGSADTMAGEMAEVMEEAGGDGFLMYPDVTRRSIMEVCDGLAPALRKRGVIRDGYAHKTFRDNLLDF
ncbi:NtaA/DmoA family FMN-dependent monooxygenase [Williamsia sp. 1135]|uniref:NtaA/DmoA family FMN-dependent monooxygenase n=1 Tax=Williamsia sp. 1135 TaxID=1889262 RepID=UPI000A120DFB|nr:NtaA/DmoA family FMN-dependent monooxygenase [Williamsia sp. 1135]ORM34102.1 FMNH2-dependent monooxygenase [Williamsia sp. 1135]